MGTHLIRLLTSAALLVAAAAAIGCPDYALAAAADVPQFQGRWAYIHRSDEYMATTPSTQDADTWLLVACRTDKRLTVAVMRTTDFAFPLVSSGSVTLRATGLPDLSVTGRSIESRQVVIDPGMMRHVMPQLIDREHLAILIPEQGGAVHEYTFLMQPNDRALAPLRSLCLSPGNAST